MSATSQHGFHPDAQCLSAFAERALQERERVEVLAHLAVCGHCRQVVALARNAADAGVEAPAKPRKAMGPNAWWNQWRLVWVPAAVAVAFAVTTISVFIERAERRGPNVKIAEQNPPKGATPAAVSQSEQVKSTSTPAPIIPEASQTEASKLNRKTSGATTGRARANVQAGVAHDYGGSDRIAPMTPPPVSSAELEGLEGTQASNPLSDVQQAPPQFAARSVGSSYSQPSTAGFMAEQKQAEQQRQAQVAAHEHLYAARSAPAARSVHGALQAAPPTANQTVTVSAAPPIELQPPARPAPAPMVRLNPVRNAPTLAKPIQLPSGLTAVSTASGGHFLLALDAAGTLFLSQDQGVTWERIPAQWTGRAVAVRRQPRVDGALQSALAAQNGTPSNASSNASPAPSDVVSFELSNDQNQTWVSTDGRTWASK